MPPILPPMPDCLHYLNAFCLYHSLQFLLQQHRPPLLFFPSLRHNWDEFQSQTQNHSWCFTAVFCVRYIRQRISASPTTQDCLCVGTKHKELNCSSFTIETGEMVTFPDTGILCKLTGILVIPLL